jgi:DNA-binding SARP family transcriptional activator
VEGPLVAGSEASAVLAQRHDVPVVLIDAPAGHGRSALLRAALASGAPDGCVDVDLGSPSGPMAPQEVVAAVRAALAPSAGADIEDPAPTSASSSPAVQVRAVLAAAAAREGSVALVVDDLHRAGREAMALYGEVARSLPVGAHLVLGGAGLGALHLGGLIADGVALRVGRADLTPPDELDPEVLEPLLADALRFDVGPAARRLLEVAVALRQTRRRTVTAIAAGLLAAGADPVAASLADGAGAGADADEVVEELERLPLVEAGSTHLVLDDRWVVVAGAPDPADLRAAASAAGRLALEAGDLDEAGRLAVAAADAGLLRSTVRAALASQPPKVGAHDLRHWDESGVLPAEDPHRWWLAAASRAVHGAPLEEVFARYGEASAAFRAAGDADAEISVGQAAAIIARRRDDLGSLVAFIGRAGELVEEGNESARGPALLGEALVWQMGGDPEAALATLDRLPGDAFDGDWAAQVAMVRGTNLVLLGRLEEAIAQLSAATGWSGSWSSARALELLALARWRAGDRVSAIDDLVAAGELAREAGAADLAASVGIQAAVLAAAGGRPDAPRLLVEAATRGALDDEAQRNADVARSLLDVDAGDVVAARRRVQALSPPPRAVPTTYWTIALQVALIEGADQRWSPLVDGQPALRAALEAGRAAAHHLAGGALAGLEHRSFLPHQWCERGSPVIELGLLGAAEVRADGRRVEHRAWERGRVRELAAHLALVGPSPRELIAEQLWPDLDAAAGTKNLRVTLTYLLDVLDPDRAKGEGSDLVVEQGGVLGLVEGPRLRIDVRELVAECRAMLSADASGDDPVTVAAARRLVRHRDGPLLGGASIGAWSEAYERERAALQLRAIGAAGSAALRVGDPALAEELGRRGLRLDPWAERLHQLVVRACLARDDLDAARRELRLGVAALHDLGVRPEPATWALARQVGIRLDARALAGAGPR